MSNLDLLPRADLPVIWEDFKTKVDKVRRVAETLTVTSIDQKDDMALARRVRLNLREIRVAVEHKRVELGEGHLKEIQKVNGAAKAIREFIEPLEARLLVQETFADRAEADRIVELTQRRNVELESIRLGASSSNAGNLSQADYDIYVARLRSDKAEKEETNRLRVEAERKLAEQAVEMRRQEEAFLEKLQAEKVAENARLAAVREEAAILIRMQQAEAQSEAEALELQRAAEYKAERAIRAIEQARLDAEKAVRDADAAEQKRIRDEQFAKLEAELKAERAVKLAEAEAARKLSLAPDVEKLRAYRQAVKDLPVPSGLAPEAEQCFCEAVYALAQGLRILDQFCERNTA